MPESDQLRIPVATPHRRVRLRYSPLPRQGGVFDPASWPTADLQPPDQDPTADGWYTLDLTTLNLADGEYEYDFAIERPDGSLLTVPDPFAEELTKLGYYRGIFHIRNNRRLRPSFDWSDEFPPGVRLPANHEMVIYELPMRWIDPGEDGFTRQVGLGTFDKAFFEWLTSHIDPLGVNTIELLPVQDSPDTLNWGYGTRFFFAPDQDLGASFDLKLFIKACHRRGIRVILDVVMNHSKKCPLEVLAHEWFYIDPAREELFADGSPRDAWGGQVFRYRDQRHGAYLAREFHYDMARFWVREYHVDGFRIDEFKGINHWDFIREFRRQGLDEISRLSPARPFAVIAEDSWRRAEATQGADRVVDAIWDFDFRDEVRRLVSNTLATKFGQPGRHERVAAMLSGERLWAGDKWRDHGFSDMAQRVAYCTSHDVEGAHERRLYSFYLDQLRGQWEEARRRYALDPADLPEFDTLAREMVVATFALMLTSRGVPMFLAGEEFADLHDLDPSDWRRKMSDPVDWYRLREPGHSRVARRVKELIHLRVGPQGAALRRNELAFFGMRGVALGFQGDFDDDNGGRVFAFGRSGGQALGSGGQVAVIANGGWQAYPRFQVDWPWPAALALTEHGGKGQPLPSVGAGRAELALDAFQVRVFSL